MPDEEKRPFFKLEDNGDGTCLFTVLIMGEEASGIFPVDFMTLMGMMAPMINYEQAEHLVETTGFMLLPDSAEGAER